MFGSALLLGVAHTRHMSEEWEGQPAGDILTQVSSTVGFDCKHLVTYLENQGMVASRYIDSGNREHTALDASSMVGFRSEMGMHKKSIETYSEFLDRVFGSIDNAQP